MTCIKTAEKSVKRRIEPGVIFLVAFYLITMAEVSYAVNTEHWNDLGLSRKLSERLSASLSNRTKFKDIPFNEIYITSLKFGIGYSIKWDLTLTPSYRIDWIDRIDKDEYEHRYSLQLDYKKELAGAKITLTQITESRHFTQLSRDHTRLRFRLNMSANIGAVMDHRASFYLMPEIFYDDIKNEIFRFRFYSGFDIKFKNDLTLRIGHIVQSEDDRADVHLFNTGLTINIK